MEKNRLEAFSDGVIAIIITIMVLEMKVPHGDDLAALKPVLPVFLIDGGYRLLDSPTRHHRPAGPRISAGHGHRQRLEGQYFPGALPLRHSAFVRESLDRHRPFLCWSPRSGLSPTAESSASW